MSAPDTPNVLPCDREAAEAIIAVLQAEQDRLDGEDYIMDTRDCINVIREHVGSVLATEKAQPLAAERPAEAGEVDWIATLLLDTWKRVDPTSGVTQHPTSYVANFADMARAVVADRQSAMPGRVDRWLPIKSAPTNRAVLVRVPGSDYYGNNGVYAAMQVDMGTGRRWMTFAWACGRDLLADDQPDAWMPMPAPGEGAGVESDWVAIWSGEHRAYWRLGADGSGAGYTGVVDQAGVWRRADAVRLTRGCGPDKLIVLHDRPEVALTAAEAKSKAAGTDGGVA